MSKQFERVYVSAGRDYQSHSRYEYCVFGCAAGEEEGEIVERQGGFKSNAAAKKAGLKAAEKFAAPSLF